MAANPKASEDPREPAWRDFKPGSWKTRINVHDFIQRNYTPYEGDASFLAGATERTSKVWERLLPLLAEEREKGVLAVSQEPSSIRPIRPAISTRTWS
jgi:formate C-acetyltransferase